MREIDERLQQKCAFCRNALPKTEEESDKQLMKRVEANDPVAMCSMGLERYHKGDYKAAFEYFTKATALGDAFAHYQLSILYDEGLFVEKDEKRELHHTEQAAIGGDADARHNLACLAVKNGQFSRAVKHWIIAAKLGLDDSLDALKLAYRDGHVNKEDFDATLRGYQAAIDATKSPQREEADKFYNNR